MAVSVQHRETPYPSDYRRARSLLEWRQRDPFRAPGHRADWKEETKHGRKQRTWQRTLGFGWPRVMDARRVGRNSFGHPCLWPLDLPDMVMFTLVPHALAMTMFGWSPISSICLAYLALSWVSSSSWRRSAMLNLRVVICTILLQLI